MGFAWNFAELNWAAIVVAALSYMAIASLWYSKLVVGRRWMQYVGLTDEIMKERASYAILVYPLFTSILLATTMALIIENVGGGLAEGVLVGGLTGIGVAVMFMIPHYVFAYRPMGLALIDTVQVALVSIVMGVIIGAWR